MMKMMIKCCKCKEEDYLDIEESFVIIPKTSDPKGNSISKTFKLGIKFHCVNCKCDNIAEFKIGKFISIKKFSDWLKDEGEIEELHVKYNDDLTIWRNNSGVWSNDSKV